jgi:hypothetical protein
VVAGAIGGRLLARLFTELPAQVTLLGCPIAFAPFKLDEAVPGFLDAYHALYNSAADLQWSAGFFARTRARLFNPREVRPVHLGASADPSLLSRRAARLFRYEGLSPGVHAALEVLRFLKQRIEQ